MATFTLPKNSKITGKSRVHKAEGAARVKKFKIYRYDPDTGDNPRYDTFEIDLDVARRGGMEAQQLRAAANAPIQGSSADIIKLAMIQLQAALQQQSLPARLLLQVHDELVLEVEPSALEDVKALVVSTMETAVELSVPLVAETGSGSNWMEAK